MSDDADGDATPTGQALVAGELRRWRERAGLTQTELANRVGYTPSYICTSEKPSAGLISEEVVKRVDHALSADGALVALHAQARAERLASRAPAEAVRRQPIQTTGSVAQVGSHSGEGDGVEVPVDAVYAGGSAELVEVCRRELLGVLEGGSTRANVEVWEHVVLDYGFSAKDQIATVLLGDIATDLRDLQQVLVRCRSASALLRLTRVAAQLAGLMCLTLIKLDDRAAFRRWARTARVIAAEVEDPETTAWVFAQESYGHFYSGDLTNALAVARSAQRVTVRSNAGSALAAALEARAHAALGRAEDTRIALRTAETILGFLDDGRAGIGTTSAFSYNEAQLRFHESNALTHLGDTRAAWQAQDSALQLIAPENFMDRAFTQLDRAMCLVHDRDPTAAAAHAVSTLLHLSREQRAGIIASRAHQVLDSLPMDNAGRHSRNELRDLLACTDQGVGSS